MCSNRACTEASWTNAEIPIGRLYDRPEDYMCLRLPHSRNALLRNRVATSFWVDTGEYCSRMCGRWFPDDPEHREGSGSFGSRPDLRQTTLCTGPLGKPTGTLIQPAREDVDSRTSNVGIGVWLFFDHRTGALELCDPAVGRGPAGSITLAIFIGHRCRPMRQFQALVMNALQFVRTVMRIGVG